MIVFINGQRQEANDIKVIISNSITINANESLDNNEVTISNKSATYRIDEDKLGYLLPEGHIETTHA